MPPKSTPSKRKKTDPNPMVEASRKMVKMADRGVRDFEVIKAAFPDVDADEAEETWQKILSMHGCSPSIKLANS